MLFKPGHGKSGFPMLIDHFIAAREPKFKLGKLYNRSESAWFKMNVNVVHRNHGGRLSVYGTLSSGTERMFY
jgi:hypothetical protein